MSHTPGPWLHTPQGDVHSADGKRVALIFGDGTFVCKGDARTMANARLVAAAPELLAFVQRLLDIEDRAPLLAEGRALLERAR